MAGKIGANAHGECNDMENPKVPFDCIECPQIEADFFSIFDEKNDKWSEWTPMPEYFATIKNLTQWKSRHCKKIKSYPQGMIGSVTIPENLTHCEIDEATVFCVADHNPQHGPFIHWSPWLPMDYLEGRKSKFEYGLVFTFAKERKKQLKQQVDLEKHPNMETPVNHVICDPVNHPKHYTSHPSGIECIDVIEHMPTCLGNAIKYIWRADLKNDAIEDLKKAAWYIDREIKRRERFRS